MKYLLDTNVLIECLRQNRQMAEKVMAKGKGHDLAISSVTYGELMVGILKNDTPRRRAALRKDQKLRRRFP
ncbi:MAG: type II toxin-antitoxin system VapC family toxin [Puniceicoccaceae bacterium]